MQEMVLRGRSQYDCLLIYENLAIAYLGAARDRWGELQVDYPEPNIWNEHPFYILDVPWSDSRKRAAASRVSQISDERTDSETRSRARLQARQSGGLGAISGEPADPPR